MVAEDAGLGVGSHKDGADIFYAGWIVRHQFFPERALSGLHIEAIDACGKLSGLINVQAAAIRTECDRLLARIESRKQARLAARCGIQISLFVGANGCDLL